MADLLLQNVLLAQYPFLVGVALVGLRIPHHYSQGYKTIWLHYIPEERSFKALNSFGRERVDQIPA